MSFPWPRLVRRQGVWIRKRWYQNDLGIVKEIIEKDDYRLRSIAGPVRTVIDGGAHIGTFAIAVWKIWPEAKLVPVEVNWRNLSALDTNLARRARPVVAALSYSEEPVVLLNSIFSKCSAGPSDSEVVPASRPQSRLSDSARRHRNDGVVPCISVERILEREGWSSVDLIKLDIEGGEVDVLAGIKCQDRIGVIVGEFHRNLPAIEQVVRDRWPGWQLKIISRKHWIDDGAFHLVRAA